MRFALVVGLGLALAATAPGAGPATPSSSSRPAVSQSLLDRQWPASWIAAPGAPARDAGVFHFRRFADLPSVPGRFVVHVSADNRYILHVNGRRVGEGPARSDLTHWMFESYDLAPYLVAGRNLVAATVWNFGVDAPMAQMSRRTGFLLQGDDAAAQVLDTNKTWAVQIERGHAANPDALTPLRERHFYYAAAPGERRDAGLYDWQWDRPESGASRWVAARELSRAHPRSIREGPGWMHSPEGWLLVPSALPPMTYEPVTPGAVVRHAGVAPGAGWPERGSVRVEPGSTARILLDRGEIVNAYPAITVSGGRGARVRLTYAEALYDAAGQKGKRGEIEGKDIAGMFDELIADGGAQRRFEPLWFRSWRYLEVAVTTADAPITVDRLEAHETRYPLTRRASFDSDDPSLTRIFEVGWRTARLAAHETYMDAPYWEQLQYVGDTRIDALLSYALSGDDTLARRAMELFDWSRGPEGITQSRYPTAEPQYIPPYALFFVDMVHEHWMYVGDRSFAAARLPATRTVLDWFLAHQRADGLLDRLPFWVHGDTGTVLDETLQGEDGGSGIVSIQFLGTLNRAAELEDALGDRARAAAYRAASARVLAGSRQLWDAEKGLMADTPAHRTWSHPVNITALLEGAVPEAERRAVAAKVLAIARHPAGRSASGQRGAAWPMTEIPSASYYFRFYLASALDANGLGGELPGLLEPWRAMLANGLTTWAEHPEPTRSDCHAWTAHPSLDLLRVVAGVRPGSAGFATVRLAPALGPLTRAAATHPHPRGVIEVSYTRSGRALVADVTLPAGLTGELLWNGERRALVSGPQRVTIAGSVPEK